MSGTLQASVIKDEASATNNLTLNTSGGVTVGQNLTVTGTSTFTGAASFGVASFTGSLGNVTTGTINSGNITSSGTVADATGTLRPLVSGTNTATTSGSSVTITGIPSWAKRVTIMFNGVASSGATYQSLQLGSGSLATTGYGGVITVTYATSAQTNNSPASSFYVINQVASTAHSGSIVLVNVTGNTWIMTSIIGAASTTRNNYASGIITLSGALDRVGITDPGTFTAGSINILYE